MSLEYSNESGLPALALKGVEDSKMSWSEFRNLADQIPNCGRDNIGRYSSYITGESKKGLAEESLAHALDEQIEKLISSGSDLEGTKNRLVALNVPDYALKAMVRSAIRISPDQASSIATAFGMKDL